MTLRVRHLPPTAVSVQWSDLRAGLAAMIRPQDALAHLQSALPIWTGSPHCFPVSSGRAALTIILQSLGKLSGRRQVIVPAYTCPTVVQAVWAAGLEPTLCDVSPQTFDLERAALWPLLGRDTLAVVATHLFGLAQDVSNLITTGREQGFFVVEDAAQALGASMNGRPVGSQGDAGIYSLGRGKSVPAGCGGVIVAQAPLVPTLQATLSELKASYHFGPLALARFLAYGLATRPAVWWWVARSPWNPARMKLAADALAPIEWRDLGAVPAAIAASILGRLEAINRPRRANAHRLIQLLEKFDFISLPAIPPGAEPIFLRLPIVTRQEEQADQLFGGLQRAGIGVSRMYHHALPELFPGRWPVSGPSFPGATRLAHCLLTLPTHSYWQERDFARLSQALHQITRGWGLEVGG